jgi:hypothetical protein
MGFVMGHEVGTYEPQQWQHCDSRSASRSCAGMGLYSWLPSLWGRNGFEKFNKTCCAQEGVERQVRGSL